MAKRAGKPAREQGTDAKDENGNSKGWSKLIPTEKAAEFDASVKHPRAYAERNFTEAKPGEGGKGHGNKAKHKKQK